MDHEQVGIKTPEYVSLKFQLAGLGSRSAAFIIDQVILMTVNILIFISLVFLSFGESDFFELMGANSLIIGIAIIGIFVINYGYFIVLEFFAGGRTVGKRIVGIRVIQENGHSLTLLSSFIRNFLRLVDSLPSGYFLGILMIFFHSKHKRIGDLVAGTIVIHERKAKGKKKLSPIEKEIQKRGLTKDNLIIDEWALKSIDQKDWKLIQTYSNRFTQVTQYERQNLTRQIAGILFPKLGLTLAEKSNYMLEDSLLVLYLILREEWEYEL